MIAKFIASKLSDLTDHVNYIDYRVVDGKLISRYHPKQYSALSSNDIVIMGIQLHDSANFWSNTVCVHISHTPTMNTAVLKFTNKELHSENGLNRILAILENKRKAIEATVKTLESSKPNNSTRNIEIIPTKQTIINIYNQGDIIVKTT